MSYILTDEISDKGLSSRGKTLLSALAYVMDSNAQSRSRKHEFSKLGFDLAQTQKRIEENNPKQDSVNEITSKLFADLEKYRQEAQKGETAVLAEKEKNIAREKYLQKALTEEGYFEWRNRSIEIKTFGRNTDYTIKNENTDDYRRIWEVDSKKVMEAFWEDLKACLPEGVPVEAFDATYFGPAPTNEKTVSGAVTFNESYEEVMRETIIKMTELNLARLRDSKAEELKEYDIEASLGQERKYDDAQLLASRMIYVIETDSPAYGPGNLTLDILREKDSMEALKKTDFNVQMPLLNVSQFAEQDEDLKDFREKSFGGRIGRTQDGFERVMNICMGKYAEQQAQKINMSKILSAIDREMEQGLGSKGPGLSQ